MRIHRIIACFLLFYIATPYSSYAEEVDSEVLRIRHEVLDFENNFNEAKTLEEKRSILINMERYIYNNVKNKENVAQYLMWNGHCYYNINDFGESSRLFKKVYEMPDIGDFWHIDASRMLAQTELFINNNPQKATDLYTEILNKVDHAKDSHVQLASNPYLEDAYSKGALSLNQQANFVEAINLRNRALADKRLQLSPEKRSWLKLENARAYVKDNQKTEAVSLYEDIFKENPSFGLANGDIVSFRLEQVEAYQYKSDDPRKLALLLKIWNNQEYSDFPQILTVGAKLTSGYSITGDLLKSISVGEELLKRIESLRDNLDEEVQHFYSVDDKYVICLVQLSHRYMQMEMVTRARELIELFLKEFPDHELAGQAKHCLEHLNEGDPLCMLDLSQKNTNIASNSIKVNDDVAHNKHSLNKEMMTKTAEHKLLDPLTDSEGQKSRVVWIITFITCVLLILLLSIFIWKRSALKLSHRSVIDQR